MRLPTGASPRFPGDNDVALRAPAQVMTLARLGSLHATRLSFARALVRRIARPNWRIQRVHFNLDDDGYGYAVYHVRAPGGTYSFTAFANELSVAERSDRVIAEKWDTAFALSVGEVGDADVQRLRACVPLQEQGHFSAMELVISRANKSVRLFESVVSALAAGQQPSLVKIARVGYLLRTTAVYGNGKFGLAEYNGVCTQSDFATPFSAQLFTVYMVRHFSLELVEHIARRRAPCTTVKLATHIKRFFGVGNATGLGMAPFLVNHPHLLHRWLCNRERALAYSRQQTPQPRHRKKFIALLTRAIQHYAEIVTEDAEQSARNHELVRDLKALGILCTTGKVDAVNTVHATNIVNATDGAQGAAIKKIWNWHALLTWSEAQAGLEAQEALVSLILEVYPQVNVLDNYMNADEHLQTTPSMSVAALKELVERNYDWALARDYAEAAEQHVFWYRSEEKEEPRLGLRDAEPGAEREMALDIARRVANLYQTLAALDEEALQQPLAIFLLHHSQLRGIVRRVQGLAKLPFAEVRENLISARCRPLDLLRCKLSLLGASKFDPKSDKWTRITLFQGAPLLEEINDAHRGDTGRDDIDDSDTAVNPLDDWAFPCRPQMERDSV